VATRGKEKREKLALILYVSELNASPALHEKELVRELISGWVKHNKKRTTDGRPFSYPI